MVETGEIAENTPKNADIVAPAGWKETLNVGFLCAAGVMIIGLHRFMLEPDAAPIWSVIHWAGWAVWGLGVLSLLATAPDFKRNMGLVYVALALLGITPITTDVSYGHILSMGTTLGLAVAIPYGLSRWGFKDHIIRFKFHHGRRWTRMEIFWVVFAVVLSYLLIPYYLSHTGAWKNWEVQNDPHHVFRVFIGTNGLGLWDELFFVNICLGVLRRYFTFKFANFAQAILFTSFLYELGFTGWGPIMIYIFALLQGITFRNTESLLYVIVIHLSIDLVLFLALVNLHQPHWADIFVTMVNL